MIEERKTLTNEKSNRLSNSLVISPTRTAHGRKEVMKTTMDSFEDFLSRKQTFSEVSEERIERLNIFSIPVQGNDSEERFPMRYSLSRQVLH